MAVMAKRYIVVTASDDTYAPLARDLVRSLRANHASIEFDIGMLDLGLSETVKANFKEDNIHFVKPGVDIEYPGRLAWETVAPFYRAMTSRPFLRDYFPGYDAYMWMDADSWVQTPDALDTMLPAAAEDQALYIASEIDRDYSPYFLSSQPWEYHFKWYHAHFPEGIVSQFFPRPMLNTGVLALSAQSLIWAEWAATFKDCLASIPALTKENFMSEQLSLNVALHLKSLPFKVMPSEFNWLSLYALPLIDAKTGHYLRPTLPRTTLSVIHLTHKKKLGRLEMQTTEGQTVTRSLTYSDYECGLSG